MSEFFKTVKTSLKHAAMVKPLLTEMATGSDIVMPKTLNKMYLPMLKPMGISRLGINVRSTYERIR